jgi:hypothetical protein
MGSVAPKARADSYACGLFLEIQRQTNEAGGRGEDPNLELLADLLADAIAHPDSRRPVLLALASFISISMSVGAPDPASFCPHE